MILRATNKCQNPVRISWLPGQNDSPGFATCPVWELTGCEQKSIKFWVPGSQLDPVVGMGPLFTNHECRPFGRSHTTPGIRDPIHSIIVGATFGFPKLDEPRIPDAFKIVPSESANSWHVPKEKKLTGPWKSHRIHGIPGTGKHSYPPT